MEINISRKDPCRGDVVWAVRLPFHCGIYEDENTVIHSAPPAGSDQTKKDAVIHITSRAEFANGSVVLVIEFPPENCLPVEETIRRAHSRLGENDYNLLLNNCDHFATWCKTGVHCSLQVEIVKKILIYLCEFIDKSGKQHTEFEKDTEFIFAIHKIAEIIASPEIKESRKIEK